MGAYQVEEDHRGRAALDFFCFFLRVAWIGVGRESERGERETEGVLEKRDKEENSFFRSYSVFFLLLGVDLFLLPYLASLASQRKAERKSAEREEWAFLFGVLQKTKQNKTEKVKK